MADELIVVNEDGTKFCPPANPLMEKWLKEYPPTPMPEYSQVCDGYSCIWCGRCPKGNDWEVPEEDAEEYAAYLESVRSYYREHNEGREDDAS